MNLYQDENQLFYYQQTTLGISDRSYERSAF